MELSVKSRTHEDITYCFSDQAPSEEFIAENPHLGNNFAFDPDNSASREHYRKVLEDCAHPEIRLLAKHHGLDDVTRFIQAFGIKAAPLYVYTIDQTFYSSKPTSERVNDDNARVI